MLSLIQLVQPVDVSYGFRPLYRTLWIGFSSPQAVLLVICSDLRIYADCISDRLSMMISPWIWHGLTDKVDHGWIPSAGTALRPGFIASKLGNSRTLFFCTWYYTKQPRAPLTNSTLCLESFERYGLKHETHGRQNNALPDHIDTCRWPSSYLRFGKSCHNCLA
jgi:hypothetical protein